MQYMEIAVSVPSELVEAAADICIACGSGGVSIEDPALIQSYLEQGRPDTVAPALYEQLNSLSGRALLKAYLPVDDRTAHRLGRLRQSLSGLLPPGTGEVLVREVADSDWAREWRRYYHAFPVGRRLLIKPAWEDLPPGQDGRLVLELDPGMAFGCGTHASTRMCLELLEEVIRGGETVYDVGTGSGILAIAAVRLGAARVLAGDLDPTAVQVARENIARNGLEGKIQVRQGNLLAWAVQPARVIVANIVAGVILDLVPWLERLLLPGGHFIAAGIIEGRQEEVLQAVQERGLLVRRVLHREEWYALWATRPEKI